MPRISRIRFINFTYNDNRHIYDQTFDFYNGEDTLLNLQNGGGKTVLVQMMMQPVIPKQRLKDRLFKSYFANSKAPVFIMIEWILDESPKKVLTGIGVKRVTGKSIDEEESENIKVVTFISEYESESSFDIKNIELLEENRGIVKLIEFDRVVKNLSNAEKEGNSVWLFRWDLPDDKKEYARRLSQYRINQLEWKNLMVKINESEAGLNSFFNDCKSNSALIKKWFIPTIEEQLNKNCNFIENIKELIKNHAEQLVKNEDMLREKEIFEAFKAKSLKLTGSLNIHREKIEKSVKNKYELGNAYLFTDGEIKSLEIKINELEQQIKHAEDEIRELEYEKLSSEYHETLHSLEQLKENTELTDKNIALLDENKRELETSRNILDCARLNEELKNLNTKIARFETELQKESLKQEDVKNMLNDIEYSLKEKYGDRITFLEKAIENEKSILDEEKLRVADSSGKMAKIKKEISSTDDKLIGIRGQVAAFEEAEATIKSAYPGYDAVKNINSQEYDSNSVEALKDRLADEESQITNSIAAIKEKIDKDLKTLEDLENQYRKLSEMSTLLAVEKSKRESELNLFENEKHKILKIIKAYEIGEDSLFDRERLLFVLNSDIEKYHKLINDKSLENSILKKQLGMYKSGKVFELADELKEVFEENNIFVEFGYEWLRNLPDNKNAKLKLVKNNPFLPYALIVSRKDLTRIQDIGFKAPLSSVIPVIEKEKLESAIDIKSRNNIYSVDSMDFLISFDDRILNRNYLKEASEELILKMDKNNETLQNARNAIKNIELGILKIEGFSYTKDSIDKILNELGSLSEALTSNSRKITEVETNMAALKENDRIDVSTLTGLENERVGHIKKKEDIEGFLRRTEGYCQNLKNKEHMENNVKLLKMNLDAMEAGILKTREKINERSLKISNISTMLEKERENFNKYKDIESGKLVDETIENLESRRSALSSRMSGKIHTLEDVLEDYKRQRAQKLEMIEDYAIEEQQYAGREFNMYEFQRIEGELVKIAHEMDELSSGRNRIQFKIAELNSDLKYMQKNIFQRCGYDTPKSIGDIRKLDYDNEKKVIRDSIKAFDKEMALVKARENNMQRVRYSLDEYREFSLKVVQVEPIEGKIEEYTRELIREFKDMENDLFEHKNVLTALYNELESEFINQGEVFKSLFNSILEGEKRFQPIHVLNALNRVYMQIDRKLMQHSIDLKKIDSMENCIIDNTLSYLLNVYDEMNSIDRNSAIDVDGKRCKMLIVNMPGKDNLDNIPLKEYLRNTIRNCVSLYKQGKSMDGLLTNEIATYDLFDRLVGIKKIEIILMKIEPNKLKRKTWKQVIEENSDGEKFVSAFVVFISLLTYMRGDNFLGSNNDSKVLIMDNPFGPITSEHLLKPLFEISRKYNTQLICLTDLKGHSIFDRFNLIYSLNIEREVGREDEYIEVKTIKKDIVEEEDEILSASMFRIEDKSRFELVN